MKRIPAWIWSAVFGVAIGYLSTFTILEVSAIAVVPWGLLALLIGWLSRGNTPALQNGASYGFFMSFAFLVGSFKGAPDKFLSFTAFSILLSAFGALCGLVLSLAGNWLRKFIRKEK